MVRWTFRQKVLISQIDSVRHSALPEPIRFQDSNSSPSEELHYMVQVRVLEIKLWLYRPFLYYAIHHQWTSNIRNEVRPYVQKAIACSIHLIEGRPAMHRHHGAWYVGRSIISAGLLVLAAVKAGIAVDTGSNRNWREVIHTACVVLRFWSDESADFARGKDLLERLSAQFAAEAH